MEFTQNWFEIAAKGNFEKFLLPYGDQKINYLEIGCFEGMATRWVLENLPNVQVTVVDTFKGSKDQIRVDYSKIEERFNANIRPWLERVVVRKGKSQDILGSIVNEFDVIYVDGSHLPWDVLTDIVASWHILKIGGIMIMDDYAWSNGEPKMQTPKIAIDSFLACFEGKYKLLLKGYQVVIKKLE